MKGRGKIKCVLDSSAFRELLLRIHHGENYAHKIASSMGKKYSSPILFQLKKLEAMGLLKSKKEKLLNKTIFHPTPLGITTILFCGRIEKEKRMYLRRLKDLGFKQNEGVQHDGGF